jgi:hypothetical protein
MIYDDFTTGEWPSSRWMKFRSADHDLWDPATIVRHASPPESALTLSLRRFTQSHPNHVKALMLSTSAFEIEPGRGFIVRTDMAVRIFGTEANPHGLEPGDPRLAAGALVTIDPETGMVFDFFVSNDRIRPLYERLPGAHGPAPCYSILGDALPSAPGEWHRYEVEYDGAADRVVWRVDGRAVAERERVGAPVGMAQPIVKPRRLRIGGGLFTLLDDLRDDRAAADDHPRIPGFIPSNWEDRFGQGAEVSFRRFEIEC